MQIKSQYCVQKMHFFCTYYARFGIIHNNSLQVLKPAGYYYNLTPITYHLYTICAVSNGTKLHNFA